MIEFPQIIQAGTCDIGMGVTGDPGVVVSCLGNLGKQKAAFLSSWGN
jgi:hypothetical protein